ncbi:MAG: hypothetical protein HQL78_04885 [Magnetococcales bacterium]|nr:hypothetical protein [Magnetococcales bacterium]
MLAETPNWLIITVGGLAALFGFWKIVGTGISLLFWVFLVICGIGVAQYGWERGSSESTVLTSEAIVRRIRELSLLEKDTAMEKISSICRSLTDKPPLTMQTTPVAEEHRTPLSLSPSPEPEPAPLIPPSTLPGSRFH